MISYLFSLWGEEDFAKKAEESLKHSSGGIRCNGKKKREAWGNSSIVPGMGAGSSEVLAFGEEGNGCWKLRGPLKWQKDNSLLPGHPEGKLFLQGFIWPVFVLFYFY